MRAQLTWRDYLALELPLPPIAGGIDVPTAAVIAEKYVRVTQGRGADYQAGIAGTSPQQFESAATAAAPTWAQAVTAAAGDGRFAAGLSGSGARWRRKAEQVGVQRFPTGVAAARPDMEAGIAPYVSVIQALTLDPRGPRGDPRNQQRSAAVGQALNQARLRRG